MNLNFELILFYVVVVTGGIALIDKLFLAKRRAPEKKKLPLLIEYSYAFFPVLLIVFLLRSFALEPFRIPSGSLEPTLSIGDLIVVNKFAYGIRLPVLHAKIIPIKSPARGDIIVFRWPPNPSYDFIKRVIGVPGDHVSYVNKVLYINGQEMPQEFVRDTQDQDERGMMENVVEKREQLFTVQHEIFQTPDRSSKDWQDIVVPDGMYFVMGDNRDDSADSRYFGFVPDENIIGKASFIWMSWDSLKMRVRWDRIGHVIH